MLSSANRLRIAISALALAIAASTAAFSSYRMTDMGFNPYTYAAGINDAGQIIISPGNQAMLRAPDGTLTLIGQLSGDTGSVATAINNLGSVGAISLNSNDPFVKVGPTLENIGLPAGDAHSSVMWLNDNNAAVGWTEDENYLHMTAYYWSAATGRLAICGSGNNLYSIAYGVNDASEVVGIGTNGHAFHWDPANGLADLGTLSGDSDSNLQSINDAGVAVGYSYSPLSSADYHGVLWTASGGMVAMGAASGFNVVEPCYINGNGLVAGDWGDEYLGESQLMNPGIFLWRAGAGFVALSSLVTNLGGYTIEQVNGLNNNDAMVAIAQNPSGSYVAVLLTPMDVVDPSSYSIFRGIYASGSLSGLLAIDGAYLVVKAGPTLNTSEAPITVVVNGTSSTSTPSDLRLSVTAHANTPNLSQTIQLWDFQASAWVTVSTQAATTSNSTRVGLGLNPARFVQSGTNAVRARVSWKQTGPTLIYQWSAFIDQIVWNISP